MSGHTVVHKDTTGMRKEKHYTSQGKQGEISDVMYLYETAVNQ